MALTNGKFANNGNLVFLSPRSQKKGDDGKYVDVEPHFEISRIVDGKIKQTQETCTNVEGDLIKIDLKEKEYNGVTSKHAVLYIKDGVETYHLDLTYRISTRSLFNAIVSLENPKGIQLSYYLSKKGYETFSLRQGDELVPWKFKIEEVPQAYEMKNKKGEVEKHDYSDVDQFYEDNLKTAAERLFGKSEKATKTEDKVPAVKSETKQEVKAPAKTEDDASAKAPAKKDDDLPF